MILQSEVKAWTVCISKGGTRVCRIHVPAAPKFGKPNSWLSQFRLELVPDKIMLLQSDPVEVSNWTVDCRAQIAG